MKKFLVIIVWLSCVAYAVGDYFVDFALKRGEDLSPPKACADIADPNLKAPPAPNFPAEDWTLESFDGLKLHAKRFSPAESSERWAILIHGYGRDGTFAYDYADEYLKRGWNVLIPDLRASGQSEGQFITMGALESRDVRDWAAKLPADAKIILHGVSMGAATALMTASLEPKNLVAVVDKIKVPVLFIHGDADGLVPFEMMTRLFDACAAPKEKFIVEGAGHADAKPSNPAAYFDRVFAFLNRHS